MAQAKYTWITRKARAGSTKRRKTTGKKTTRRAPARKTGGRRR
jgi:hypothetical protein